MLWEIEGRGFGWRREDDQANGQRDTQKLRERTRKGQRGRKAEMSKERPGRRILGFSASPRKLWWRSVAHNHMILFKTLILSTFKKEARKRICLSSFWFYPFLPPVT